MTNSIGQLDDIKLFCHHNCLFNPLIFSVEKFKLRSSNNENSKNFEIERRNRLPLFDQVIKFDHVSKSTGQSLLCIITTSKERHLTLNPII